MYSKQHVKIPFNFVKHGLKTSTHISNTGVSYITRLRFWEKVTGWNSRQTPALFPTDKQQYRSILQNFQFRIYTHVDTEIAGPIVQLIKNVKMRSFSFV
jgi:hypothetical protein